MRPGDWVVIALGVALCVCLGLRFWTSGAPGKLIVRAGGRVVEEVALSTARRLVVPGPLGETVIEVEPGRARVASDPGPRQYCVRQGWLSRAGAVAICAPNEVSLTLTGRGTDYDSLSY